MVIPDSVVSIGNGAFSGTPLESITIGESVDFIGGSAFSGNKFKSVNIPDSVTFIGSSAFYGTPIESVTIGNSVTSIGSFAFSKTSLISVVIPDSVVSIGDSAFAGGTPLESVTIGSSVKSIGESAFAGTSLKRVEFQSHNIHIGKDAFPESTILIFGEKPNITLIGDPIIAVVKGGTVDLGEGATALDDVDGDLTSKIVVSGTYDVNTAGTYELKYDVEDSSGKKADTVTRTIHIVDKATVTTNKKTYWPGETIKVKYSGVKKYSISKRVYDSFSNAWDRGFMRIDVFNSKENQIFSFHEEQELDFFEYNNSHSTYGGITFGHWRTMLNEGEYKVEFSLFNDGKKEVLATDDFTVVTQVLWEKKLTDVYSASLAISNSGDLIAMSQNKTFSINPKTGSVNWESETYNVNEGDPIVSFDGKIYIPSFKIDILDEVTGERVFSEGVEIKASDGTSNSLLTIFDQNKFVTRLMWPKRGVQMVDHNGEIKWEYSIDVESNIHRPLIVGKNGDLFGSNGNQIFCLDGETGVERWVKSIEGNFQGGMVLGIYNDLLFLVSSDHRQKHIMSLNADTGELNWKHDNVERDGSIGLDHGEDLVIDNEGYIHVNSNNDMGPSQNFSLINSLNGSSSGQRSDQYWSNKAPVLLNDGSRLVLASEALICEDIDSREMLWAFKYPAVYRGYNVTSATVDSSGNVYFYLRSNYNSENNTLLALAGNAGVAEAPWPINSQNTQNTATQPSGPVSLLKDLPAKIIVREKSAVILSVKTSGALPKNWQWYFDGAPISGQTKDYLRISNIRSQDEGTYSVSISNELGKQESKKCYVRVLDINAPKIFADGKEVVGSVVKGDKAEITLSTSFEGGAIFYTLDGSEPSFETTLYDGPFTVSKTTGIRAVAYKGDFSDLAEADPVFINIVPNYSLNVSVQGQGTVVKEPGDGPYIQDSVVKIKAIPEEGWRFAGWSGALKSSFEVGSVVMSNSKDLTALFEAIPTFRLAMESTGGGQIEGVNSNRLTLLKGASFEFRFDLEKNSFEDPNLQSPHLFEVFLSEDQLGEIDNGKAEVEIFSGIEKIKPDIKFTSSLQGPYIGRHFAGPDNPWPTGKGKVVITNLGDPFQVHSIKIASNHRVLEKKDFTPTFQQNSKVDLNAVADNGFEFISWLGDASGADPKLTLTMDRDKVVETVFGTDLSTIATGKGRLILNPLNGPYPYGTKVNITPVPDAGYYLGVWGLDALGMEKGPIEYEITKANPKITALFVPLKENRFTVTTLASSGGSVVSNPNSNAYVNGQEVTLTATPDPGYSFVGWTGDIESTVNPLVTLADANKTVTAQFRRNIIAPVTLTIDAKNGTVTRNPADELYEMGTSVELLAQPNPGYTFTGWAGALGGTASRTTLFLDGDKEVTANFKASYQLATETRGPGSVLTTPSSTTFIDGDEVILTASPAEGYGFVGWTGDLESTDQQTTLAMDNNKRVIAHFAQLGTLTTWTRGEGTITRSPDKESYFPGASVTLTATAGDGFQFVSWDGQASGTANPTTVTMDRAMSVAANFKDIKAPTVTIVSPASQETGDEVFNLSGTVTDNGKIKSLVWLWKGKEMSELELVDGKFSLEDQKLVGGANDITVIATDRSGNEGKATATPVWTPNRSIRIAVATEQQEGNRIEVPIEINSKGDVGGMGFVLNYNHSYLMDPVLTWSSAAGGSINLVNEEVAG
ncbi:leucine-rich repeat protein, partial [bacterium]|nr:leucine-rich repeat protein [bacterium]